MLDKSDQAAVEKAGHAVEDLFDTTLALGGNDLRGTRGRYHQGPQSVQSDRQGCVVADATDQTGV